MTDVFTLGEAVGHLSYLLIALSYWLTNIYWLRVAAVAGLLLQVIYFYSTGTSQVGAFWGLVFVAINIFHLVWLTRDRLSLRLPAQDAPLLREALSGLDDAQIARLIKAADWRDCSPGEILTRQDAPVDALFFLCRGRANVEVNGSFVTYLEKGSFIGEIAYLTGNPATATVTIEEPSRLLAFSKMRMAKVVAADEQISGIVYQLLGRDLAMKMRRTNTRRVLTPDDEGIRV
ncbi:MAG: cyclic nucleotide-binding domain-containing protein [Proteobacteria bacterium]|nr:cyclic nucleotide-binding domain-containing protein [Pseudomonadota bacterium]